jgi:hypothetical protein
MIDPLEVDRRMLANRTDSSLLVQTDGFWLDTADKKEHFHLNYT